MAKYISQGQQSTSAANVSNQFEPSPERYYGIVPMTLESVVPAVSGGDPVAFIDVRITEKLTNVTGFPPETAGMTVKDLIIRIVTKVHRQK